MRFLFSKLGVVVQAQVDHIFFSLNFNFFFICLNIINNIMTFRLIEMMTIIFFISLNVIILLIILKQI